jgi:hypothetical protein
LPAKIPVLPLPPSTRSFDENVTELWPLHHGLLANSNAAGIARSRATLSSVGNILSWMLPLRVQVYLLETENFLGIG